MQTPQERLQKIMKELNLKPVDVVRKAEPYCNKYGVKLTKVNMSYYLSGRNAPNQKKLFILALVLNVNEAWLLGYDVPQERGQSSIVKQSLNEIARNLGSDDFTDEEINEIYNYCKYLISKRGM